MLYCASFLNNGLFLGFDIILSDIHAELELHPLDQKVNLVERLLAEVPEFHQLVPGVGDEVGEGVDLSGFQAVVSPHRKTHV